MRILGIDPGTSLIGYGIIDYDKKSYKPVKFGVFRTPANIKNANRVLTVYDFIDELIKKFRPDKLAIENIYFFKNNKTVIEVSEIRGIILLAAVKNGITPAEFTPLQVKQAVTGYGRAEKKQIQRMVQLILSLKTIPEPDDAADALAIAICCANTILY
ncbi:MAG: crossover junction endodeoxyribonuclease RuvC [Minisyncoccia bacterium]